MSVPALAIPSGVNSSFGDAFVDPFQDVASANMPMGIRSALRLCERVYIANGSYRMAQQRIFSYFLTELEFLGCSDDTREKYKDFTETIGMLSATQQMDIDVSCYGNGFATILVPFKRFLVCPRCYAQYPLKVVFETPLFHFQWHNYDFNATCPKCKNSGPFRVNDLPEDLEKRLQIKIWNPHEIEILHDLATGDCAYFWRIPEDYKLQIRRGQLFHLERVSAAVLQAIKHNYVFRFHPDVMFHMKESTPSGIRNRGWGIPRILTNFRQIYYVQILKRYNEALALDYVIPFRLITPVARTGAATGQLAKGLDPLLSLNMGDFTGQVKGMLRRRRRDPASWFVLPFPVQYQSLGGDASQLAPRELIDQGLQQLLNDAGTPVELYNGTLTLQTAPVALRLFEATNIPLVRGNNQFLNWVIKQVAQIMQWETVKAQHRRVTYADDISRQMAMLQLMTGQQVSGTTGLGALGLSWIDEQRRIAEEAKRQNEIQTKVQEEMEEEGLGKSMAGGGGTPPAGGQPQAAGQPAAGGAGQQQGAAGMGPAPLPGQQEAMEPVTSFLSSQDANSEMDVQGLQETANTLASQLAGLPHSKRRSELNKLRQSNESLHSLVTSGLKKIREQSRSQGQAMIMGGQ